MSDDAAIRMLLTQSRTAHSAYQQAKQNRQPAEARAQLQIAADARHDAHAADPQHSADAWFEDAIPGDHATATHHDLHAQLTEFYQNQLSK